jgi:hypothetical protein
MISWSIGLSLSEKETIREYMVRMTTQTCLNVMDFVGLTATDKLDHLQPIIILEAGRGKLVSRYNRLVQFDSHMADIQLQFDEQISQGASGHLSGLAINR